MTLMVSHEDELTKLVHNLDTSATKFGPEMRAEKTKIMTNNGTLRRYRGSNWKQ